MRQNQTPAVILLILTGCDTGGVYGQETQSPETQDYAAQYREDLEAERRANEFLREKDREKCMPLLAKYQRDLERKRAYKPELLPTEAELQAEADKQNALHKNDICFGPVKRRGMVVYEQIPCGQIGKD